MLRLQLKSVYKKTVIWIQLILFSIVIHGSLLGLMLFFYKGVVTKIIYIDRTPYNLKIPVIVTSTNPKEKDIYLTEQHTPKIMHKKTEKTTIKDSPFQSIVVDNKEKIAITQPQKNIEIKKQTAIVTQKQKVDNKISNESQKKTIPKKLSTTQTTLKAKALAPPLKQDRQITKITSTATTEKMTSIPLKQEETTENMQKCIVKNYRDKIAHLKQAQFEQSLSQAWHPPVGIQGKLCRLKIHMATDGAIKQIETVQSSGLIMYDVQARSALLATTIPSEIHGSTIEITFEC